MPVQGIKKTKVKKCIKVKANTERKKKYNKTIDIVNKETKINDKTIKEHENDVRFKLYCIDKNKLNYQLYNYYE